MAQSVGNVYSSQATTISREQLKLVTTLVDPPACLLGGWAVHIWVNKRYQEEKGQSYIGSRDIDLGFPVNPDHGPEELQQSNIGRTFETFKDNGFYPSTFGFQKYFDAREAEELTEDEATVRPIHDIIAMRVDIQPDTQHSDAFKAAFGFQPPAEPLLSHAFDGISRPLNDFVEWKLPDDFGIVEFPLLAAMKTRSFPGRSKHHKQVKDLADLYALIWYIDDWQQTLTKAKTFVEEADRHTFKQALDPELITEAAELLGDEPGALQNVFDELAATA